MTSYDNRKKQSHWMKNEGGFLMENITKKQMEELVDLLNRASHAYYNEDREIMSNFEYDEKYDELVRLETETGVILPNSPTQHAGYEVVSKLKKVKHEYPALSLNKTKDRQEIVKWLNHHKAIISWKMDGLTIVATYQKGKLIQAVTRGNGEVGEDITHNAKYFIGLPTHITYKGKLIVRGEAVMMQEEFERINSLIPDVDAKYKNARNLASATVRLLDSSEASQRKIHFYGFDLVFLSDNEDKFNSNFNRINWLKSIGINTVETVQVDENNVVSVIDEFEKQVKNNEFPSDGLVVLLDDVAYGKSLGMTGKYPKNGIAFKWKDEEEETTIRSIEWSASRTGLLNPVAIFDPVELEGTTVSRASIHNVSIAEELRLGIGTIVKVYKANMIIPQISKTVKSTGETIIPKVCPVCGKNTEIKVNKENGEEIKTLYCTNSECPAKHVGKFTHFVGRDCMNIVGLSEATLEKFLDLGYIKEFADIYKLQNHRQKITEMEGFGEKSYKKLISAIEDSKTVKFSALLNAIGIAGIGKDMAKQISKHLGENALVKFTEKLRFGEDFSEIDGIGQIINQNIYEWKANRKNGEEFANLVEHLIVMDDAISSNSNSSISGKVFVITGSVHHFENREKLKEKIESLGGKATGSVSAKTDYLINNDTESTSSKNKKAKELGVKIISEEEFLKLIQ